MKESSKMQWEIYVENDVGSGMVVGVVVRVIGMPNPRLREHPSKSTDIGRPFRAP